ncbi:MAG: PqqD family peptide modification chaperone [bacterium]
MWIKLSKYTFIRHKSNYIYIFNQLNYSERYYDLSAEDFILSINKTPKKLNDIVTDLLRLYDVERKVLKKDFIEFIEDLEQDGIIVIGKTAEEVFEKEEIFSYKRFEIIKNYKEVETNERKDDISCVSSIVQKDELFVENLYLEVTRRCNERCLHCYIPQEQRSHGEFIKLDDAKNYIDQAKDLGIWELTITGGEPFLHPKISEILQYARSKDVIIVILSNLTLISKKHISLLKEIYPSHIQVSLYSLNADTHDAITNLKGSHNQTMRGIDLCYKNDIPLQINCPINELNRTDFKAVKNWAKVKGIKANIDFFIMAQTDNTSNNLKTYRLKNNNYKKSYKDFLICEKVTPEFNFDTSVFNTHICGSGYGKLFISEKGKVYPCSVWKSFELGDLNNNTLKDIYQKSKKIVKLRGITIKDYESQVERSLMPFINWCPGHFANSNQGDYTKIPDDVLENARIKKEVVDELLKERNKSEVHKK